MKGKLNPWPLGIVAAFVIFIAGMATAVVIACTQKDSLVTRDYYEQELKFQSRIDSAARARNAGAGIAQDVSGGKWVIHLPVAQLAQNLAGNIELYRPSAQELDHAVALQPDENGNQTLNVSRLAAGAWVVRVKWNAGGLDYFLEKKIKI